MAIMKKTFTGVIFTLLAAVTIGAAVLAGVKLLPLLVESHTAWSTLPLAFFMILVSLAIGTAFLLLDYGQRHLARSTDQELRFDSRPHILYLRSFRDDARRLARLPRIIYRPWRFLTDWLPPTAEQVVTEELSLHGPVLAIGRPGETLPPRGAAREYISHDKWQERATLLMQNARWVLFGIGTSDGLLWELKQVCDHVPPRKVILVFPCISNRELRQLWHEFVIASRPIGRLAIPEDLGQNAVYAWFADDWTCHILRRSKPSAVLFPRTSSDYRKCLKYALKRKNPHFIF
jgi:hypothetical protein